MLAQHVCECVLVQEAEDEDANKESLHERGNQNDIPQHAPPPFRHK